MTNKTKEKWYSNGLNEKEAKKLWKRYAIIGNPTFGVETYPNKDGELEPYLELRFHLNYESSGSTDWRLINPEDIKNLFVETKTYELSDLEGKVIEAYCHDEGCSCGSYLVGLSVNKHLIP